MLSRRKFFGAAAAASVAVAVPSRYADRFARTLEDRETSLIDTASVIFRFFRDGEVFLSYPVTLPSVTRKGTVHIGANERVLIKGFNGRADDLGISLAAFPEQVTMIGFGNEYSTGVNIFHGDTLTLEGNPNGFLTLS